MEAVVSAAVTAMTNRGLTDSAVWASSMIVGARVEIVSAPFLDNVRHVTPRGFIIDAAGALVADPTHPDNPATPVAPAILLARALLARQEYRRCIHALRSERSDEAVFLQHYAWYLDGERQAAVGIDANGESATTGGLSTYEGSCSPSEVPQAMRRNPYLSEILRGLGNVVVAQAGGDDSTANSAADTPNPSSSPQQHDAARLSFHNDPYLCWLYGVVASKSGHHDVAIQAFASAVSMEPLLWCAWKDLSNLVRSAGHLAEVAHALRGECVCFPWVVVAFTATTRITLSLVTEATEDIEHLLSLFPGAGYVHQLKAQAHTAAKDYEQAKAAFLQLRTVDNYQLEGMDDFSNALFVLGDRRGLSSLALDCFAVDPFRAESNCVAGNLYGIMGLHDRSLLHFRRAVAINPHHVPAWTLLGHEFLEVHNTSAAVSAYRAAITLDEREYRAWYGLGQIYELLQLYPYALHYYTQTTLLRPQDSRMWVAVAGCLEKLHRPKDAVACLDRAAACEPVTSEAYVTTLRRIAQHCATAEPDRAAEAYRKLMNAPRCRPQEAVEAQMFLVTYLCDRIEGILDVMPAAARAASFDSNDPRRSGGQPQGGRVQPRAALGARREEAAQLLAEADAMLQDLGVTMGATVPMVVARRSRLDRVRRLLDA
jgi:tetratricopeptide (TPR) repeat protein